MADEDVIEHTLFVCRDVKVYRIPPRPGAGGYRSGDWKVGDNIFTGMLRMVAKGSLCEVRLQDNSSGDLFALCPIPPGKREVCVEPVTDSSRYYVLRVEDPVSKRHAFLGLGFTERGDAFDFSAALSDHERQLQREAAAAAAAAAVQGGADVAASVAVSDAAVAVLYKPHVDLGLKEGETIRINVKKPAAKTGLLGSGKAVPLVPLAPPPASGKVGILAPPPGAAPGGSFAAPRSAQAQAQADPFGGFDDLLSGSAPRAAAQAPAAPPVAAPSIGLDDWATF